LRETNPSSNWLHTDSTVVKLDAELAEQNLFISDIWKNTFAVGTEKRVSKKGTVVPVLN
jgi:hypothetical protein